MKHLLLFACLLTIGVKAQTDTLFFNTGAFAAGTVKSLTNEKVRISLNGQEFNYATNTIIKFVISESNPNKKDLEAAYINYLDAAAKLGNRPSSELSMSAGQYLKRGGDRIIAGAGISIGAGVLGGVLMAVSKTPTAGAVVVGVGGIIGAITAISGAADISRAGILLK